MLLNIKNLWVKIDKKIVLKGIDLKIEEGKTYVIFGPNGSGKSTLLKTIMGIGNISIERGDIIFKGKSLLRIPSYKRALLGIGLAFQNPPEVKGVKLGSIIDIIKSKEKNEKEIKEILEDLKISHLIDRDLNYNFSGGEKKVCEVLQLIIQNPDLVLLDEPDSGVDVERIRIIAKYIKRLLEKHKKIIERKKSGILVTHNGEILNHIKADVGFIMIDGKISKPQNPEEVWEKIKRDGYRDCYKCFRK